MGRQRAGTEKDAACLERAASRLSAYSCFTAVCNSTLVTYLSMTKNLLERVQHRTEDGESSSILQIDPKYDFSAPNDVDNQTANDLNETPTLNIVKKPPLVLCSQDLRENHGAAKGFMRYGNVPLIEDD